MYKICKKIMFFSPKQYFFENVNLFAQRLRISFAKEKILFCLCENFLNKTIKLKPIELFKVSLPLFPTK